MTGYVTGDLIDPDGADELFATAEQSIAVAASLGIPRLNLHGTGLDSRGLPIKPVEVITGEMWLTAEHTLARIAALGQREGVIFCLEKANQDAPDFDCLRDHKCPGRFSLGRCDRLNRALLSKQRGALTIVGSRTSRRAVCRQAQDSARRRARASTSSAHICPDAGELRGERGG